MVQTTVMWHCAGGCEMGDKGFGVFRAGDGSQIAVLGFSPFCRAWYALTSDSIFCWAGDVICNRGPAGRGGAVSEGLRWRRTPCHSPANPALVAFALPAPMRHTCWHDMVALNAAGRLQPVEPGHRGFARPNTSLFSNCPRALKSFLEDRKNPGADQVTSLSKPASRQILSQSRIDST